MLFYCRMEILEMMDPLKIQLPHQLSQYFKGELHPALVVFLMRWTTPHQSFGNIYRYSKAEIGIYSLPFLFIWCYVETSGNAYSNLNEIFTMVATLQLFPFLCHQGDISGILNQSFFPEEVDHTLQVVCKNKLKESKKLLPLVMML